MTTTTEPILVTRAAAARLLSCSDREIDRLREAGLIQAVRHGNRIRIVYASLLTYVATLRDA